MSDNDILLKILQGNRERAALALSQAKEVARAEGKQPFDLSALDRLWPMNPDKRNEANGSELDETERIARWEQVYYVELARLQSMEAFVEAMKARQLHGAFD